MSIPLYQSIYKDIKSAILNGEYKIGEKLPTDKIMSKKYRVSTITIKNAMDLLVEDDLVSRKPRQGTIVISNKVKKEKSSKKIKLPLIGLIMTDFSDSFGSDILRNMIQSSQDKAQIIFKLSNGDSETEGKIITELVDIGVDGIILLPGSSVYISNKLLELTSNNFPMVLIDRAMKELPTCNVQINNNEAAKELTENLFENGHRHIGIITAKTPVSTITERIDGVITAHVVHHIPFSRNQIFDKLESMIPNSGVSWEDDVDKIKDFLLKNDQITAIVAGEYSIATLVQEAINRLENKIYEDYSVVCFDHPGIDLTTKSIFTHIRQDQKAIGEYSFELILEKIKNPSLVKKINAPYELVQGTSVRKI